MLVLIVLDTEERQDAGAIYMKGPAARGSKSSDSPLKVLIGWSNGSQDITSDISKLLEHTHLLNKRMTCFHLLRGFYRNIYT